MNEEMNEIEEEQVQQDADNSLNQDQYEQGFDPLSPPNQSSPYLEDKSVKEAREEREKQEIFEDVEKAKQQEDMDEGNFLQSAVETAGNVLGKVGDAFETVDKAVLGKIGTKDYNLYKARRGTIDFLGERHVALALLGEIFIPDSVDIMTAGLGYIPRRFIKAGKVLDWAKMTKAASKSNPASDLDVVMRYGGKFTPRYADRKAFEAYDGMGLPTGFSRQDVFTEAFEELSEEALDARGQKYISQINNTPPARQYYSKKTPDSKGRYYDLDGTFDLDELQKAYPGDANATFRRDITALAADPRFGVGTFEKAKGVLLSDWINGLEDVVGRIDARQLEVHHVRSIRHVGALFNKLGPEQRAELTKALLNNMFPVGHNPKNFMLIDKFPHLNVVHKRLDAEIGKYAEEFIERGRNYTIDERIEIAKEMGKIIDKVTQAGHTEMIKYMDRKVLENNPAGVFAEAALDIADFEKGLNKTLGFLEDRTIGGNVRRLIQRLKRYPDAAEMQKQVNREIKARRKKDKLFNELVERAVEAEKAGPQPYQLNITDEFGQPIIFD